MGSVYSSLVFLPPPPTYDESVENFQWISGNGRKIPARFGKYNGADHHGNAEDIGLMDSWQAELCNITKCDIIIYDYVGYGCSEPRLKPSERGFYDDVQSVYQYLREDMKIEASKIILFGRSIGSGPTVHLASLLSNKERSSSFKYAGEGFSGMILLSPIASCVKVAAPALASVPGLDMFQNYKKIPHVNAPIFIAHGNQDDVVPYSHGEELKRLSRYAELHTIDQRGHNDIEFCELPELVAALDGFTHRLKEGSIKGPDDCKKTEQSSLSSTSSKTT